MVEDIDLLWRQIAETFERRHILAHEAATTYVVTLAEANSAVETITTLVMAIDALLWHTVWKDGPLTGLEMHDDAKSRYEKARSKLAQAVRLARRFARKRERTKRFRVLHWEWREYARGWGRWEAEDYRMGSMRVLVHYITLDRLYTAREQDVTAWCNSFEPMSGL
jgi:hypothetical protein